LPKGRAPLRAFLVWPDNRLYVSGRHARHRRVEKPMRAVWYERTGPADAVLTVGEQPTPQAGPGQVRVRLGASGVNPAD
jgi:hypothetical protein